MGSGKLGESWRAPNASWGVTGADGKRAGFRSGFQGAAWEADTPPAWRRGLAKEPLDFAFGEPCAGVHGF